eukprot:1195541-Prorocentrum_minimum.AAC.7
MYPKKHNSATFRSYYRGLRYCLSKQYSLIATFGQFAPSVNSHFWSIRSERGRDPPGGGGGGRPHGGGGGAVGGAGPYPSGRHAAPPRAHHAAGAAKGEGHLQKAPRERHLDGEGSGDRATGGV